MLPRNPTKPGKPMVRKWFASWNEAQQYASRAGMQQRPEKRPVWVDYAWREEWSLEVEMSGLDKVDETAELVGRLRAQGDTTGAEAAALIEWLLDQHVVDLDSLTELRADPARAQAELQEAIARLFRIGDHLRTLAVYADGSEDDHAAPRDPWPERGNG